MATTHTETVLNNLRKSELVQLVLQTKASLVSQIANLITETKDLLGYKKDLLWNKCKKPRENQRLYQFYTINRIARVKLEKSGLFKIITHMFDLVNLSPDIDINSL